MLQVMSEDHSLTNALSPNNKTQQVQASISN